MRNKDKKSIFTTMIYIFHKKILFLKKTIIKKEKNMQTLWTSTQIRLDLQNRHTYQCHCHMALYGINNVLIDKNINWRQWLQ